MYVLLFAFTLKFYEGFPSETVVRNFFSFERKWKVTKVFMSLAFITKNKLTFNGLAL